MAPPKPAVEHTIDRTPEYEEFMASLRAFHEKRGTPLDAEPRMGNINVDLLKLFNFIMKHGGYDKVSEEKLKWRQMCDGLGLSRTNAPADAYALKQIFYKNLAAYEIKTVHKKEPPPPEILEYVTAKGGSLLTRTLENFHARGKPVGAPDSERSGDDATPSREKKADENPTSGRASRGLREAPPQRVPFTPDTHSTRQTRHASSNHHHSSSAVPTSHQHSHAQPHSQPHPPTHGHSPMPAQPLNHQAALRGSSHAYNPPGADFQLDAVQNYQPPRIQALPLRSVDTPSSNPEAFSKKQRLMRQQVTRASPASILCRSLPAAHLEGPNIYERCLLSLRSSQKAEQAFALNHLVKISYERGDKYKFAQFHGLAEGLTEKALEIGSLFYDVKWTVSYDPDMKEGAPGELDGIKGTSDILQRISRLRQKDIQDGVQSADFTDQLMLITEALLTIRNMVMLPDNAYFMSEFIVLKDLLCIILNLPNKDIVVELKHFALDIAEQITPNLIVASDDPLYRSLLSQLQSTDRGIILTALRAIGRIAMNSPTETNKLDSVSPTILRNIMDWLLLNDDELMDACLDFLYQYTAVVSNLETLLESTSLEHVVFHLVRLLSHGAKRVHKDQIVSPERAVPTPPSEEVLPLPRDLLDRLIAMDEPERCYTWIKCLFEEDPESQITQIAIWQAFNAAFLEPLKQNGRTMINAAEFIRNINQVYQAAGAQIVRDQGPMGEVQRFIIKGIRPRLQPISPDGQEYIRCLWARDAAKPRGKTSRCGAWLLTPEKLWEHVLTDHVGESRGEDQRFQNKESDFTCRWGTCSKYKQPTKLQLFNFMGHVKTHIMAEARVSGPGTNTEPANTSSTSKRPKTREVKPAKLITVTYEETATFRDERNPNAPLQAAGIPLSAILVLRNIARNVAKTKAEERLLKVHEMGGEAGGWNERVFRPVTPRLYEIMTENRVLAPHVASLLQLLEPV